MPAPCGPRVWAGAIVYLIALLGTWLLANESARPWAVLVLVASAMLAVVLWRPENWISAFPSDATARTRVNRSRLFYLTELASITRDIKRVAFLFFPGNEQYQQTTHELFPGGKHGEVTSRHGKHLFYT